MTLRESRLLEVLLDVEQLALERELLESAIGLPEIEVDKYDAGSLILALAPATPRASRAADGDGLVTVFGAGPAVPIPAHLARTGPDGGVFTSANGHRYAFRAGSDGDAERPPAVAELRLAVSDLAASVAFYRDLLGLELLAASGRTARLATGSVTLGLEQRDAPSDPGPGGLLVFHAPDIEDSAAALAERGLAFETVHPVYDEHGGTIRFADPSGHRVALYRPSYEGLTRGSGWKLVEVIAGRPR